MGVDEYDHEGRMITLEFEEFFLINIYAPNSKQDLSRLAYRIIWEKEFRCYLEKLQKSKPIIICGDFNVAHIELDVYDAKSNYGNAGFTDAERAEFLKLLNLGFIDTFRYFYPNKKDVYTWWNYLNHARDHNTGWRIDYFLVSYNFLPNVKDTFIYDNILGSDHCPIGLEVSDQYLK